MDWWLVTFFIGALLSLFLPIVPEFSYVFFFTVLAFVSRCQQHSRKLVAFFLACAWFIYHGATYNQALLENSITATQLYQKNIQVLGVVDNLIIPDEATTRINFIIHAVNEQRLARAIKVRLSWQSAPDNLQQGQVWQIAVKLKPAHGLANQGGFSYRTWLRQHHLIASGYVKKQKASLLNNNVSLRQRCFNRIYQLIKNEPYHPLYLALTFGVRDKLSAADWQVLTLTGTQHLLAISGLHIGLVAGASYYVLLLILRLFPCRQLPLRWQLLLKQQNLHFFAITCSILSAFFYSYLAGFSAPTSRALIMLSLFWLSKVLAIKLTKTRLLLLTLFFILLLQPMSLLGAGFWLSFYAVVIIFFMHWAWQHWLERYTQWQKYLASLVLIQLGLTVFILPIAAVLQNQLPLAAFFANIIAVPLMSIVVLPLVFSSVILALFSEFNFLLTLAFQALAYLWQWLTLFQSYPNSLLVFSHQQILVVLTILLLSIFAYLSVSRLKQRLLLWFLPALLAVALHYHFNDNTPMLWQVKVFDVGQGLAVLIQKDQQVILYDTGASYPSGFIMAESVIAPYLKSQGITTIDKVIISHSDNDHAGGLTWLRTHFIIKQVIANAADLQADDTCLQGQAFYWQALHFEQLWPLSSQLGDDNDHSCVIRISDGVNQVLLTGDISKDVEQQLIINNALAPTSLNAAILIAPHHGSNTSSSVNFINAVKPNYVVFSAGFMNQWQMPTQQVLSRYQNAGITQLTTADSGMISFYFTPHELAVLEYKKHQYAFWFAN